MILGGENEHNDHGLRRKMFLLIADVDFWSLSGHKDKPRMCSYGYECDDPESPITCMIMFEHTRLQCYWNIYILSSSERQKSNIQASFTPYSNACYCPIRVPFSSLFGLARSGTAC